MKIFLFILCFTIQLLCKLNAQGLDNIWLTGYDCGPPYFCGVSKTDFSINPPDTSKLNKFMQFSMTCANISDSSGNLLFYTNGYFIANSAHDTMMNGTGINPGQITSLYPDGLPIAQACLIIPKPGLINQYFLFHEAPDYYPPQFPIINQNLILYKSEIDISLNGGLGIVTFKNDTLLSDTIVNGELTACKHGNGRDWWLISHKWQSDLYYKLLISPTGITGPFTQNIGAINGKGGSGQVCFSPDGEKYARFNNEVGLEILDFDRCSGMFSNPVQILINDSAGGRGVAFSPNSKVLYASSTTYVYQFNLDTSNIAATQTTVAVFDGFYDPSPPYYTMFYLAKLAPDNKIYIVTGNGTQYFHVIENPDSLGLSCNLLQHNFKLPTVNFNTLPNQPNYHLGAWLGSACDTITGLQNLSHSGSNEFFISPNPSNDYFTITFAKRYKMAAIIITDITGKIIYKTASTFSEKMEVNTKDFAAGIYLVQVQTKDFVETRKVIVSR